MRRTTLSFETAGDHRKLHWLLTVHHKTRALALWGGCRAGSRQESQQPCCDNGHVQQPRHCHWVTKTLRFSSRIYSHLGPHELQRQARKPELIAKNCHEQRNTSSLASVNLRLRTHAGQGTVTYPGFGAQNCWDWFLRSSELTHQDTSLQTFWFKPKT